MLKEALQYLVSLREIKTYEIDGEVWSDNPPHKSRTRPTTGIALGSGVGPQHPQLHRVGGGPFVLDHELHPRGEELVRHRHDGAVVQLGDLPVDDALGGEALVNSISLLVKQRKD